MKTLLTAFLTLISCTCFSQIKSIVIDSHSGLTIPYVNISIENEKKGTSSNANGEFELEVDQPKNVVFSAIGYETVKIHSDSIFGKVALKQLVTDLNEVVVSSSKKKLKKSIGKFKPSKIHYFYSLHSVPWMHARYFAFQEEYESTPYVKKIIVYTDSSIENAKFNVRLYGVNEKGEPEGYLYHKNIIVTAKKGGHKTTIDIADLNIEYPKTGFFVALEGLLIEDNKYEFEYHLSNSNQKRKAKRYEPLFGTIASDTLDTNWVNYMGKWSKTSKLKDLNLKRYKNKYSPLAMELVLSN
ncbi:carboxypeptidase-like regulatory domain-containing protein [Flavobacterium chuncheonense]|uniref:Carboxypeptidase-like regulatory domain-containing protein n=1 Tax=Flavobacterium chuncheonense TaxID=2026653 RepID=A0ABW5YKF1_9FLAO